MLIHPLQFRNVSFSSGLGLLLIAFILYGTTVEAAHRHGRVLSDKGDVAALSTEQTTNTTSGQNGCSDCLICQLHQNSSTTLIAYRLNDPPIQILHRATAVVTPDLLSRITSPLAGRAPPFIS